MKRRVAGLELSGRFDVAARDWSPDDIDSCLDPPILVRGGVGSSVVLTRDNRRIAGPQATDAPHGRGQGWGEIGAARQRRCLATALDTRPGTQETAADLRAAIDALARGATEVILAVPDLPHFDEAAQGFMIRAATGQRRRARLLWRPVAAFLDLLGAGSIPRDALGARYRLLIHGPGGMEEQILTLRADPDRPADRAPQRDGPGQLLAPEIGLDALFSRASEMVRAANPHVAWSRCEIPRLGPRLVTGDAAPGATEILRSHNASWVEIHAPAIAAHDLGLNCDIPAPAPGAPVAGTFLITPLTRPLAEALCDALATGFGAVTIAPTEAIARGALLAGRLIERGRPHYFDRLEPIAIAVLRQDVPDFENLIAPDEVVPANREYVSAPLDNFVWSRDKTDAEFYILKGGTEVRHWQVAHEQAPVADMPVTLRLRQTPGQSWARLSVTSRDWEPLARSPIDLDWEALTPIDLDREGVLAKLRRPPPTIPDLLIEPAHLALWTGGAWSGRGAIAELERLPRPLAAHDWNLLLRRPRRDPATRARFWLVGTDGALPEGLSSTYGAMLDQSLAAFGQQLLGATLRHPIADNDCALALTWCFERCPRDVQARLVTALEAHASDRPDPILLPAHAIRVITQGVGRAVSGAELLARVLRVLALRPPNNDTINALAMILTRRKDAPRALSRELVDAFLAMLGQELHSQVAERRFALKFRNTLSAIAGLFRWRVRDPNALLAAREPIAASLRETLAITDDLLNTPAYRNVRQIDQKIAQIRKIAEYLDGAGDPDILRFIEQDDDVE